MNRSISIIIPVYNAERYLRECFDSILKIQDSLDWELIVVDDGSRDSSPSICDEYSARDSRVRAFHIENKGVSNARNFGMAQASKDFVTFIDADDWIDAKAFASAFDEFVHLDADLGYTPFYKGNGKTFAEQILNFGETRLLRFDEKKDLLMNRLAPSNHFMGSVWRNFYSLKLVRHIAFCCDLNYQEDVFFSVQALFAAKNVAIVNTPFYYYRVNQYSANFNKEINSIENRKLALRKMLEWAKNNGVDLSYTKVRRMCPIYARMFAKAATETSRGLSRVKALWKIHCEIPSDEIRQWKICFWGKSFILYAFLRIHRFDFLGFILLCVRFIK